MSAAGDGDDSDDDESIILLNSRSEVMLSLTSAAWRFKELLLYHVLMRSGVTTDKHMLWEIKEPLHAATTGLSTQVHADDQF